MLKAPYELISKTSSANYYLLSFDGLTNPYLAIQGIIETVKTTTNKKSGKVREQKDYLPASLKLLPLSQASLYLIYQHGLLGPVSKTVIPDLGEELVYFTWDLTASEDLQAAFKEIVGRSDFAKDWSFDGFNDNSVVNGFIDDGYFYLGTQSAETIEHWHWLYRNTLQGNLIIVLVRDAGSTNSRMTGAVDIFILGRPVLDAIEKITVMENDDTNMDEKEKE